MQIITRKRIISLIITLAILVFGIFGFQYLKKQKQSTVQNIFIKKENTKVSLENFSPVDIINNIEIDGRLQAYEQVGIFSKVNGILEEGSKHLKVGTYVKKDELLFKIDDREAKYSLLSQKASLMTSITQMMPDLKFDYPNAFEKWKTYLDQFDVKEPIVELPEPTSENEKYYVSSKNIYNLFYNIRSLETRLQDYHIYAPFSGVATAVNIYPGALVSPGTNLATMINTSRYEMVAPITLQDLKYLKIGQKVELCSEDLDQKWQGTLTRIGSQIDPNTQNIPVYITVYGSGLKDGMYLKGNIAGEKFKNVYVLPKHIFVNPSSIYVVRDSIIHIKEINSVKRMEESVVIQGIDTTDQVITGSLAGLYDGQKVTF